MNRKCMLTFLLLLSVINACSFGSCFVLAQTDQPDASLQTANIAVNQAFNSVLSAEKAGANVTSLLTQLNDANGLLAQAENAYRTGDYNGAVNDASAVLPIAQQVNTAAQTAKETAQASVRNSFWSTLAATIVAAVVFVLALFFVWRLIKRNYIRNLSEAKPEVTGR